MIEVPALNNDIRVSIDVNTKDKNKQSRKMTGNTTINKG